jgi:D-3-phosphoglycerate dehydrogenase
LGRFHVQLVQGAIEEVVIEYSGKILNYNVAPLTIAILKGLLTPILKESVNFINAPVVAKERGIKVIEAKNSDMRDYTSLISLTIKTSQEKSNVAGALFGVQDPRVVRLNKFTLDVVPEGHMLVIYNYDRPGVIGNIGSTLGANQINIARLHLSREEADQEALVILSTDGSVPEEVITKLLNLPHVISVKELDM